MNSVIIEKGVIVSSNLTVAKDVLPYASIVQEIQWKNKSTDYTGELY